MIQPLLSPDYLHGFLVVSAPSPCVHRALELSDPSLIETLQFELPDTNEHILAELSILKRLNLPDPIHLLVPG